jgi:hypothetical protein
MDKFIKSYLIIGVAAVLVLLACAYVGYLVGGNTATDDSVNAKASGSEETVYYSPFTIEHWGDNGEYLGFFVAGCVGGFIVGFLSPIVFGSYPAIRRKDE